MQDQHDRLQAQRLGHHAPPAQKGVLYPLRYLWGKFLADMGWLDRQVLERQPDDWVYERWACYQLENHPDCRISPPFYD